MGHEEVPHGFGLRASDCSNTADGAGNHGRPASRAQVTGKDQELPEPQTSIFFSPRYSSPNWAKGGRKDCVCLWVV